LVSGTRDDNGLPFLEREGGIIAREGYLTCLSTWYLVSLIRDAIGFCHRIQLHCGQVSREDAVKTFRYKVKIILRMIVFSAMKLLIIKGVLSGYELRMLRMGLLGGY
jgi:hypothetical protein